jgi:hypothetical protein
MIENLVAHGRKLVTIVDPHIKKDSGRLVPYDRNLMGTVQLSTGSDILVLARRIRFRIFSYRTGTLHCHI